MPRGVGTTTVRHSQGPSAFGRTVIEREVIGTHTCSPCALGSRSTLHRKVRRCRTAPHGGIGHG